MLHSSDIWQEYEFQHSVIFPVLEQTAKNNIWTKYSVIKLIVKRIHNEELHDL